MIIKKFNEHVANNKTITTTYEKIIPGEEDDDEPEVENGWEDEDGESMIPDKWDIEEGLTVVDKAVKFLKNDKYTTQPSSSQFHVGISYSTPDPDIDYSSGEETYYSCHLNGFTPQEEFEIWEEITGIKEKRDKDINKYNL